MTDKVTPLTNWSVTVEHNGSSILTLSDQHQAGVSRPDPDVVRNAAHHLLAFIDGAVPATHTAVANEELARLRAGYERYETARLMNPRKWTDAWALNVRTGKAFDEIIDDLRPFLRPNIARERPNNG